MADRSLGLTPGLLAATVVLPLALLGLGLWQQPRGLDTVQKAEVRRAGLAKAVSALETRPVPARGFDTNAVFRENGHTYAGPLALTKAREARDRQDITVMVASLRRWLPPAVIACGAAVGLLSVLALAVAAGLGRVGRRSRDALVRGFSFVRRLLPPLLGAQVLLLATGLVAAVGFEASAVLLGGRISSSTAQLLGFAALVVGISLWTALRAVVQLRRAVALFTPDPLPIIGRAVSPAEAPGLWRMVDGLAARLGALRPDTVVVGLTAGFFVSSGPKLLRPGNAALGGRTLYLPMPFLALLPEDEVAAIIGHELAHFSGGDTEYSLSFLPIYAGVGRSLDAVAEAGRLGDGTVSPLIRPALQLGVFVMDQFHHAVRHWSRLREFAADTAGAEATSAAAAARALLRTSAAEPRIGEVLASAFRMPRDAPEDLLAAILRRTAEGGLEDPATHLEEAQPHPTDTHPSTRQRILALGQQPGALLAEVMVPPPSDAPARLGRYFTDPAGLCRAATADFLTVARDAMAQEREALRSAATEVGADAVTVVENRRPTGWVLLGAGLIFVSVGLALGTLGLQGLGTGEARFVGLFAGCIGVAFLLAGGFWLYRGEVSLLTLRPEALTVTGLDRPIAWQHVVDLDMTRTRSGVVTRMLLSAEASFPSRVGKSRRVTLDTRRRVVTVTAGALRGLKVQGYADLLASYRRADAARRILAKQEKGAA